MEPRLPSEIQASLGRFLVLLDKWNRTHALTALPPGVRREELLQDAASLLPLLAPLPAGARVVDLGTGMGCPGATIVFEELVQLGVKKLLRVGTCGGLQPHHALGDTIIAISAVPADSTAMHLVANEPHCPTASWELIHGAVHVAKEVGLPVHVGPVVSSDLFYNPDEGQYERWSKRGVLAVEMEAAALFTVGAIRGVQAGCLLTVSDIVVEGEFTRISDDDLRAAVDRMTRVALATATAGH